MSVLMELSRIMEEESSMDDEKSDDVDETDEDDEKEEHRFWLCFCWTAFEQQEDGEDTIGGVK